MSFPAGVGRAACLCSFPIKSDLRSPWRPSASPSWLRDWSQYPAPVTQVGGGTLPSSIRCSVDVLLPGWGDLKLSHALTPPVSPGDGCVVRDIEGERQSINRRLGDKCHADCSPGLFLKLRSHTFSRSHSVVQTDVNFKLPTPSCGTQRRI